jgi:hypothetical protein
MNLAAIEPVLITWVQAITGVAAGLVVFADAPRPHYTQHLITLNITSIVAKGIDDLTQEYDDTAGAESITVSASGQRTISLSVQCETLDQSPANTARAALERARTRAWLPSSMALLRDANLSLQTMGSVSSVPYKADGHWYSRYVLDVKIGATSTETDTPIESIERVSGEGHLAGQDLPFDTEA